MTKSKNSHFARGSGLFKCRSCDRNTRATGNHDNEHVQLCVECYDLAGIDNAFRDGNGQPYELAHARNMLAACIAKGGKVTKADFDAIPFDAGSIAHTIARQADAPN